MSTIRRSARIAHIPHQAQLQINAAAKEAFHITCLMRDIVKKHANPDELTIETIVWLTRLSWAIEDCREYKTRQLSKNCDQTVLASIPNVIHQFRTLTTDGTRIVNNIFHSITPELVAEIRSFGSSVKDALYIV